MIFVWFDLSLEVSALLKSKMCCGRQLIGYLATWLHGNIEDTLRYKVPSLLFLFSRCFSDRRLFLLQFGFSCFSFSFRFSRFIKVLFSLLSFNFNWIIILIWLSLFFPLFFLNIFIVDRLPWDVIIIYISHYASGFVIFVLLVSRFVLCVHCFCFSNLTSWTFF